jgi:hypothetical protein
MRRIAIRLFVGESFQPYPSSRVPAGAMHGSTSFALKNFESYQLRPRFAMRDRPVARLDDLPVYT